MKNRMVKLARRPQGMATREDSPDRGSPGAGVGPVRVPRRDRVL